MQSPAVSKAEARGGQRSEPSPCAAAEQRAAVPLFPFPVESEWLLHLWSNGREGGLRLQPQTSQRRRPLILAPLGSGSALIGRRLSQGARTAAFPIVSPPSVPRWQPPTLSVGMSLDCHPPCSVRACPGPPAAGDDVFDLCTWVQDPICSLFSWLSAAQGGRRMLSGFKALNQSPVCANLCLPQAREPRG